MIKYMMFNHGAGSAENWREYFKMLHDGGHMVGGSALEFKTSVKEGTFTPASSTTITGYILIQAEDMEAAQKIMVQSPVHQSGGVVELFELVLS